MSDFIRLQLETKLDEWLRKDLKTILPPQAVVAVLDKQSAGSDGPVIRKFVEETVSPASISQRLQTIGFYLGQGRLDKAAFHLNWLERDVEAVKNMIANAVPVINSVAAPHYERGLNTIQAARDGHAAVHGTEAEKLDSWRKQCAAFDDAIAAGKKTIGAAERHAATVCGVSQKSIGRARKKREAGLLK